MTFFWLKCFVNAGGLILKVHDYAVTILFRYFLYCVCFNFYSGGSKLFCNVLVGVCMCGFCNVWAYVCVFVCVCRCRCFGNMYSSTLRLRRLRFFCAFSSVVRQMPG